MILKEVIIAQLRISSGENFSFLSNGISKSITSFVAGWIKKKLGTLVHSMLIALFSGPADDSWLYSVRMGNIFMSDDSYIF